MSAVHELSVKYHASIWMRLKNWPSMEDSVDSRKEPLCGSLWCPMDSLLHENDGERFARMTGTHDWVVIDLSLSFPRRRESIKARQLWNTRDLHHGQQTQRNDLHIGVINNLKKWVRVTEVPSVGTNRALISSRRYQSMCSMCFDNLINSWFMSSLFSRRALNRSSWGIFGCLLFYFGQEVCKVIRPILPKTCKFSTNDSAIFPYRPIHYCFIQGGLVIG